ncbi:U-box domain-containing protein [Histoplasma capsulatum G186AR]|uniref:U-box domain-containing protein n=2 Tax=Ajellomyces capsulatus TaxID=5037 RepID=C0NJD1_AJECG|nr:U-box domain-containing protein [Histoplasma capsulatum G186AR]EEH07972.1 U-box domain-containing protein [Histoplasma capsulatum G186AR]KAG5299700.1 U-box domain-containing protein [Histoplasma capsulatum]QSS67674.1 U-box domain-containing protein [Histoplasma capsulatum G186AR]
MDPVQPAASSEDDFEIIDDQIPIRPRLSTSTTIAGERSPNEVGVQLHPLPDTNSMILSVHPPLHPEKEMPHVPCDIVLCIDVSYSMQSSAPLPTTDESGEREETGLSVLDLTKHAARTIIETLNENDRLGIVAFSTEAEVVYKISKMNESNKKAALKAVEALKPLSSTNLWHGLKLGLKAFENERHTLQSVQALYVLTDGMPNHMCPKQGYVTKLRPILQLLGHRMPMIHTFGFGYNIRSGLLQAIAEVGGGTFAFIPDAGMIGTVFVHAIANLYTTFATQAKVTFQTSGSVTLAQELGSKTGLGLHEESTKDSNLTVAIGTLQYGQSRDLVIRTKNATTAATPSMAQATLTYQFQGRLKSVVSDEQVLSQRTSLPVHVSDYHLSRARICAFLRSLYPLGPDKEYTNIDENGLKNARQQLDHIIKDIKQLEHTDEENDSLVRDLAGEEPEGQLRLSILVHANFAKWGKHYLLSLLNAHTHQMCNSFKDPGPLQYGKNSPFFCRCREELDTCFDNLPPPKPSIIEKSPDGTVKIRPSYKMSRYNCRNNPCFAGHCNIRLAERNSSLPIRDIRAGIKVWTPLGPRRVRAVLATAVKNTILCNIGSLSITPWHPIQVAGDWIFPSHVSEQNVPFSGTVYSVLLDPSPVSDAHAIMVEGHVCVSLGHGIQGCNDVRAHPFFGSYPSVLRSLASLPRDVNGILRCSGMKRNPLTGLACGFIGEGGFRKSINKRPFKRSAKVGLRYHFQAPITVNPRRRTACPAF